MARRTRYLSRMNHLVRVASFLWLLVVLPDAALAQEISRPTQQEAVPTLQCPRCSSWAQPSGEGIGLGIDEFGTASAEEFDLNVVIPFGWLFALRVRPLGPAFRVRDERGSVQLRCWRIRGRGPGDLFVLMGRYCSSTPTMSCRSSAVNV